MQSWTRKLKVLALMWKEKKDNIHCFRSEWKSLNMNLLSLLLLSFNSLLMTWKSCRNSRTTWRCALNEKHFSLKTLLCWRIWSKSLARWTLNTSQHNEIMHSITLIWSFARKSLSKLWRTFLMMILSKRKQSFLK